MPVQQVPDHFNFRRFGLQSVPGICKRDVEIVRIADGKIVEWWVEMDRLWMSEQLGFEFKLRA